MEQIVCLDGFTLNPGDLDWSAFEGLGSFTLYSRTPVDLIIERARDATMLLTNKTPLSRETLACCPKVKYIGVLATGYNVVDIAAAAAQNITVTNVPTYSTESVAQHTIALLLDLARNAHAHHLAVQEGRWVEAEDFCFTVSPIRSLEGLTMGFFGLGRIGGATARIASSMGLKIRAYSRSRTRPIELGETPVEFVDREELFRSSDILSLHCPLTSETHHLINERTLALMKSDAYLINTSRGPLLDSAAVAAALKKRQLAGAAVDVLETEPPPADHPLLHCPHCVITPHIAWYAYQSRASLMRQAAENAALFLAGKPVHTVSLS